MHLRSTPNRRVLQTLHNKRPRYWSTAEHQQFKHLVYSLGYTNTKLLASLLRTKTPKQIHTHRQKWLMRRGRKGKPLPPKTAEHAALAQHLYCDETMSSEPSAFISFNITPKLPPLFTLDDNHDIAV